MCRYACDLVPMLKVMAGPGGVDTLKLDEKVLKANKLCYYDYLLHMSRYLKVKILKANDMCNHYCLVYLSTYLKVKVLKGNKMYNYSYLVHLSRY